MNGVNSEVTPSGRIQQREGKCGDLARRRRRSRARALRTHTTKIVSKGAIPLTMPTWSEQRQAASEPNGTEPKKSQKQSRDPRRSNDPNGSKQRSEASTKIDFTGTNKQTKNPSTYIKTKTKVNSHNKRGRQAVKELLVGCGSRSETGGIINGSPLG